MNDIYIDQTIYFSTLCIVNCIAVYIIILIFVIMTVTDYNYNNVYY